MPKNINIALAQISPVWLNKEKTLHKVLAAVSEAAEKNADLVAFGEGLVPGYPFWLSFTNGSEFESDVQKDLYALYVSQSVDIEKGDLDPLCTACKSQNIACYIGIIERAADRGGHSLYCSLVYIDKNGQIMSVHRKLQPTYEERLVWSPGDGNGLKVHQLEGFRVGGLNCWENWMPLARTALYAQGENVHIAVWPGSKRNTEDITRFIAKEARSYVVSVGSILKKEDIPQDLPHYDLIIKSAPDVMANGGSCVAMPNGEWIFPPAEDYEGLFMVELELDKIYRERQNFDPSGHYSRPDVTKIEVNFERQNILKNKNS